MSGAVFADVESANIVGYANKGIVNGNQLVGFSFKDINAVDEDGDPCVDLAKIEPQGYQESEYLKTENYGTWGDISFQILKSSGFADKIYDWYADCGDGETWEIDGWYLHNGAKVEEGEVTFKVGDGIWYNMNIDDLDGTVLPSAGEAIIDSQSIPLVNGNQAIANPCSYDVKLVADKVVPQGYQESEYLKTENYGTWGDISFQILKSSGFADKIYDWYADCGDGETWEPDGWYVHNGAKVTVDDDVTIKMGDALWVNMNIDDIDEATLEFPGIDELAKAE